MRSCGSPLPCVGRSPPRARHTKVMVLCSLGLWILLWGVVGGLLAIPLTCVVRLVFEFLAETWPDLPYASVVVAVFHGSSLDSACVGDGGGVGGDDQRAQRKTC